MNSAFRFKFPQLLKLECPREKAFSNDSYVISVWVLILAIKLE